MDPKKLKIYIKIILMNKIKLIKEHKNSKKIIKMNLNILIEPELLMLNQKILFKLFLKKIPKLVKIKSKNSRIIILLLIKKLMLLINLKEPNNLLHNQILMLILLVLLMNQKLKILILKRLYICICT